MKVLVDTNVILDVLQACEPFVHDSALVWKLCETGRIEGLVSVLSFANLVYVMRRELSPQAIDDVHGRMEGIFRFVALTPMDVTRAAVMGWRDFEDAMQCATDMRMEADYMVTRNVRDFREASIPAVTPAELLARMAEETDEENGDD